MVFTDLRGSFDVVESHNCRLSSFARCKCGRRGKRLYLVVRRRKASYPWLTQRDLNGRDDRNASQHFA